MPSCEIQVRVTPRSSRNKIEVSDDGIKVWTTSAPTDGQANTAVCELVAKKAGVPKTAVDVVRGHTSREKTLSIQGLERDEAIERLRK